MEKIYYIVDIKKRQRRFDLGIDNRDSEILSLTPYSSYILDKKGLNYSTFHSIISIKKFSRSVFKSYNEIKNIIDTYKDYGYIFKDLAIVKNYEIYLDTIFEHIENKKNENYKIVYITDTKKIDIDNFSLTSNETSAVHYCKYIDETILIEKRDKSFYSLMKIKKSIYKLLYTKSLFSKIFKSTNLYYDHINFKNFWKSQKSIEVLENRIGDKYREFKSKIEGVLIKPNSKFNPLYSKILNSLEEQLDNSKSISSLSSSPFVYLSNHSDLIRNLLYKNNSIPRVFWQHGSYFHEHIFLDYHEINYADINLVCNEYTKELFRKEKEGGESIYNVGSINFNKKIIERKRVYDYIYIVNNMHYSWSGTYIDSSTASYTMDGDNLYHRHRDIIKLFGEHFIDKKICIKMQPSIVDSLLYVPLLELSIEYPNVTIEFFIPLMRLVEESKYIISDYFSSEFLNRELHYKRDIILFSKTPTPLPIETIKDMKKMFILVETVDDLEERVKNIEKITKNRKRYDDIIEYYSSKRCDTREVVLDILEKELV